MPKERVQFKIITVNSVIMELLVWFVCVAGTFPTRFFVGHSIYKGKAALTVEPRAPEFTPLDVCLVEFPVRKMVFDLLVIVVIGLFFMVLGFVLVAWFMMVYIVCSQGHSKYPRTVLCCFSLLLLQVFVNMIGAESR